MSREHFMQRAIELAQHGRQTTTPNPNVGCVIVKNEKIIGEGFHERAGQPHAEINALHNAQKNGCDVTGATAYVTLEPCSHFGKTPPCADALIDAGISEVIIGSDDPNPHVAGRGIQKLRDAGIIVIKHALKKQCDELNLGFFKRMTTSMPWVSVKLGMSLDAKIATASGESQWITGAQSRADVQQLRAQTCAIMTSSATVIADNPSLNVRLENAIRQPKRVIVDSQLSVSADARIFSTEGEVIVYSTQTSPQKTHAQHMCVPEKNNHADLQYILRDLGTNQECNRVLVEAGGRFVGALLSENLVDELIIYTAPTLLGEGARPAFNFPAVEQLIDAQRFLCHASERIGNDIKTMYRKNS